MKFIIGIVFIVLGLIIEMWALAGGNLNEGTIAAGVAFIAVGLILLLYSLMRRKRKEEKRIIPKGSEKYLLAMALGAGAALLIDQYLKSRDRKKIEELKQKVIRAYQEGKISKEEYEYYMEQIESLEST